MLILHCFHAFDESGKAIYHTNVLMSIGEEYMVVCMDSILNPLEQKMIKTYCKNNSKTVVRNSSFLRISRKHTYITTTTTTTNIEHA